MIRYPKAITNKVGGVIGKVISRGKEKEARGLNNMADLIKYARETKGNVPNTDYRDPEFRKAVMAKHAKADFMSKDKTKKAKRYYQDKY